ncbi:hypothetical protein [Halobacillus litoralis]|uniref:Uncharacterized protein n=1 Tax=Halobacillus litoralis TaxID=45668 RepID=A0A410M9Y1_9BACI|nr:hypothetical protein [Halobacillus litoralis]QAS51544.1 hypothetical protein HLI_04555 [Halobacillus litoralis]
MRKFNSFMLILMMVSSPLFFKADLGPFDKTDAQEMIILDNSTPQDDLKDTSFTLTQVQTYIIAPLVILMFLYTSLLIKRNLIFLTPVFFQSNFVIADL